MPFKEISLEERSAYRRNFPYPVAAAYALACYATMGMWVAMLPAMRLLGAASALHNKPQQ